MHPLVSRYIARHEPRHDWRIHAKSVAGTTASISLIGALAAWTGLPMLLAPLAPSALLIFGQPNSPGAQPINIFVGYLIGTIMAVLSMQVFPEPWWLATIAVGLSVLVMLVFRVTHAPAAAVPLLVYSGPVDAVTLFVVLLLSCTLLVLVGVIVHRLPPRSRYPLPLVQEIDGE
jgi:CBS-domain-containing membrane protein